MKKYRLYSWLNIISLLIHVAVAYASNTKMINGNSMGEVSAKYDSLFAPAGFTFSIWSVLYISLLAFAIYHLVRDIEKGMKEYSLFIDRHRILVLNYKIAILYFGSGDYETSIDYLQRIINDNTDLRDDLQCYARLVHLLAHYELGNTAIIESLIRSVYRFMSKMKNLTVVEEQVLRFLRQSFNTPRSRVRSELAVLLGNIKHLEKNRFQTRSFAYLDLISWLESKISGKSMTEVIRAKYLASKRSTN